MCGIFGCIGEVSEARKVAISKSLFHRGPDKQAFAWVNGFTLFHSRLSIIDSSGGSQPFLTETVALVFNGEIYNYKELIKKHDLQVNSKSDTEVIIRLYEKLGKDSYTKLVQPLVESLGMGTPPSQVLAKALALISNPAKEVAEEAKLLVDTLCEGATATLEDANNLVETDPLQAFLHLERIILNYKNTAIANKARATLPKVDKSKKVIIEKQARIKLETII